MTVTSLLGIQEVTEPDQNLVGYIPPVELRVIFTPGFRKNWALVVMLS